MDKIFYQPIFKDKKITVMGLGVLGRGIQVTEFLARCGAKLTVTDLKDEKQLASALKTLKKISERYNIRYVLGRHDLGDFKNVDMVIKAAGVPLDSIYIQEARKNGIEIAMDASLFAKVARKDVTVIGVTGTRGKSITTALVYHMLKMNEKNLGCRVHIGGNMRMKATLPLLKTVKTGDIAVLELDSWQCQGFGDEQISPSIAIFTSFMPDHMNYYHGSMKQYLNDKQNIFKYQKKGGLLVTSKAVERSAKGLIPKGYKGKVKYSNIKDIKGIPLSIIGDHNMENAAYAYSVGEHLGLSKKLIKKALVSFKGLEGRLEYLGKKKGVHVINDNNATTPEAVLAGVEAVRSAYPKKGIILIAGGGDKKLPLEALTRVFKLIKHTVLLPGTGTERFKKENPNIDNFREVIKLNKAVNEAFEHAKKGDVILFSPGFTSFGLFRNEYDRNDQFLKIVRKIK